jgi:hypothetical protein
VGKRSLEAIENADQSAGQDALKAVARALGTYWQTWNEDTPWVILEGGPAPALVAAEPTQADDGVDPRIAVLERLYDVSESMEDFLALAARVAAERARREEAHRRDAERGQRDAEGDFPNAAG